MRSTVRPLCLALAGWAACSSQAADTDAGDLLGVFDEAGAPSGSARRKASPRSSEAAAPSASAVVRSTRAAGCAALDGRGGPSPELRRTVGRPRCRDSEILETRDPDGSPRYACLYGAKGAAGRAAPLVLFFHDRDGDASDVEDRTTLRKTLAKGEIAPGKPGFLVLSVQGRALSKEGTSYDVRNLGDGNQDLWAVDHFLDLVRKRGGVDPQRVYALGVGSGARMAAFAAHARGAVVAAFAGFGAELPAVRWTCNESPPPGLLFYRACDTITPCDEVERALDALGRGGAEMERHRLGAGDGEEPACTPKIKCGKTAGEAHHARWPKGREKDVVAFFSRHALAAPAAAPGDP